MKIPLELEQMLAGEKGPTKQKAACLVIDLASTAGATEFIQCANAHVSGVSPLTGGHGLRFFLKDLAGDKVLGSFYEEYLIPFQPPAADEAVFKLDPNHKDFRRKNIRGIPHIFVKWLGWPKKFNQWVPANDIQHLLT